ncbi:MAG: hypothetical protein DCF12_04710 [Snowella sp.]|nr:MAG: hypothetical protein DCF12_04710 [Snowella sp.]
MVFTFFKGDRSSILSYD